MRTEKSLAIVFTLGIIFKYFHFPGGSILLIFSLLIMSLIYFPGAFYFFSDKKIKNSNVAFSVISGLFLAVAPLGILFKIQYWPGADINLLIGLVTIPIILIIAFIQKAKAPENLITYYKNLIIRSSILSFLVILLYFTSVQTMVKIQYHDNPELARLKALHYANPENMEYKRQHDEYIRIQDSIYNQKYRDEEL